MSTQLNCINTLSAAAQTGSLHLTRRIESWARENPYEYLTVDDAALKFGCTAKQFRAAVANLRADGRGCLETVVVWRAKEEA